MASASLCEGFGLRATMLGCRSWGFVSYFGVSWGVGRRLTKLLLRASDKMG